MLAKQQHIENTETLNTDFESKDVEVTPEMAAKFLEKNPKNRSISKRTVARYTQSILNGEWKLNGEAIKIASDGTLLDGQHRLQAIIEADTPVKMVVTKGLDKASFETIDTGKVRNASDILVIGDKETANHATALAATVRLYYSYESTGVFRQKGLGRLDNYKVFDIYQRHKGLARSVAFIYSLPNAYKLCPMSALAALHYVFSQRSIEDTEKFFHDFNKGTELKDGDPVLALRSKLFIDAQKSHTKKRADDIIPYVIEAWNARREGRELKRFYKRSDENQEIL